MDVSISDGESVSITGTVTITSLGTGYAGCRRELRFTDACTLTHSANLVLPGAANFTTAANDVYGFRCTAAGVWVMVSASRSVTGNAAKLGGVTPSAFMLTVLDDATAAAARTTLGAAALSGAAFTGPVSNTDKTSAAFLHVAGGAAGFSGTLAGPGLELFYRTDLTMGGINSYDRTDLAYKPFTLDASAISLSCSGAVVASLAPAGLTVGAGKVLSKITLSTAAPPVLANGELYLKY